MSFINAKNLSNRVMVSLLRNSVKKIKDSGEHLLSSSKAFSSLLLSTKTEERVGCINLCSSHLVLLSTISSFKLRKKTAMSTFLQYWQLCFISSVCNGLFLLYHKSYSGNSSHSVSTFKIKDTCC